MSFITPNLKLPFIAPAQAQKHVTHNEAIRALDALVQLSLQSRALSSPPPNPLEGARYYIAGTGSDVWTGQDGNIAAFTDGFWSFYAPVIGWLAYIADEDTLVIWNGNDWQGLPSPQTLQNIDHVGINAAADDTNRLVTASSASLFNHDGNGHQLKLNKNTESDTGSLLYQTGYSGRAEMGLAGSDDFKIKISADGSAWKDALSVDKDTGAVSLPFTPPRSRFIISNGYRFYCNPDNRWVTSSDDYYGTGYYQANETGGTGIDPTQKWQQQGLFLPAGAIIHNLHIVGRTNSVWVSDLECYLYAQRPGPGASWESGVDDNTELSITDIVRDHWFTPVNGTAFTGSTADMHRRTFTPEHEVQSDGFISLFVKPVGTVTVVRYFYATIAIECSLPG